MQAQVCELTSDRAGLEAAFTAEEVMVSVMNSVEKRCFNVRRKIKRKIFLKSTLGNDLFQRDSKTSAARLFWFFNQCSVVH